MKKLLKILLLILLLSSCHSDSKYPSINFIGGKDLISQDVVLKKNSTFKIGINSFTNSDYKLYKFKLTRVFENNPYIVIDSILNVNHFNAILTCPTQSKESIERWIFSISSCDGYTSEISVQITTSDTLVAIKETDSKVTNYKLYDLPDNKDIIILSISSAFLLALIILLFLLYKKSQKKVEDIIDARLIDYENKIQSLQEKLKEKNNEKLIIAVVSIIILIVIIAAIIKGLLWI